MKKNLKNEKGIITTDVVLSIIVIMMFSVLFISLMYNNAVENAKYINLIEKNNIFKGKYYVLNNLISPSNGLDPSTIEIDKIINIIKENEVKEVIIALKPSIEGETTALYISKLLENYDVIVSRIARGIPNGAEIDYVDSLTLEMALENRNIISNN